VTQITSRPVGVGLGWLNGRGLGCWRDKLNCAKGMDMKRTWILASMTAALLAACGGGGADNQTTGGAGTETGAGAGTTDTTTMAPTPADTALTGDTAAVGADTAAPR
jgi:hypothetical protein